MWVQTLIVRNLDVNGKPRTFHPGDWVDVGRQTALRWIAEGTARVFNRAALSHAMTGCGVVLLGEFDGAGIRGALPEIEIVQDDALALPFDRTLFAGTHPARMELLPVGFRLVETWEVAAPIWSYDELAAQVGSEDEREQTRAVVRDLRVPLYRPDVVFIRRTPTTREFMRVWNEERGNPLLAFLRALYRVKPMICALPTTWMG